MPRQVLVYLFRRRDDGDLEFLMLMRTVESGGFWQGVSGAPDWHESDDEGAIREVQEEMGFAAIAGNLQQIGFRYVLPRAGDPDEEQWERLYGPDVDAVPEEVYVAEVPSDTEPGLAPDEHDAFHWCSFDDALALLTYEESRRALMAARDFLANHATRA